MISTTTDRNLLHRHFLKDKVLFAYHLGDLDPFFFPNCRWLVREDPDKAGEISDAALIYSGADTPTVLAFGVSRDYDGFVQELLNALPDRFYCHYQDESRAVLVDAFDEQPLGVHLKMHRPVTAVQPAVPNPGTEGSVLRLDRTHLEQLSEMYASSYPGNYFDPRMLDTGKYFGCFEHDRIVAVAGIHVYSRRYDIAVLGNVTTVPDRRGKGLATIVTARLLEDLLNEGIGTICLNVAEDNAAAIRCYEKLGFVAVHRYREALFTRR